MSDITIQFEEVSLVSIGGLTTAPIDGAVDISLGLKPTDMKFEAIRLNVWNRVERKASFVTIREDAPWFFEICAAIIADPIYGDLVQRSVDARWNEKTSAYDKARDLREAA